MNTEILKVLQIIQPQLCVMATVAANGAPESAVLAYVVNDDLSLIISTHSTSRKWKNLESNKYVALSFGWDFVKPNLQYEGIAERVVAADTHKEVEEKYFSTHPELKKFQNSDTVFIIVKPTWIRLTDYSKHPPQVGETTL